MARCLLGGGAGCTVLCALSVSLGPPPAFWVSGALAGANARTFVLVPQVRHQPFSRFPFGRQTFDKRYLSVTYIVQALPVSNTLVFRTACCVTLDTCVL